MATPVPNINDGSANRMPCAWYELSADGAIPIDTECVIITKATAVAATLAAPTNPDMDGQRMAIVSATAAAHVITATDLINGTNDVITFGAAVANGVTLRAWQGGWYTGEDTGMTVS